MVFRFSPQVWNHMPGATPGLPRYRVWTAAVRGAPVSAEVRPAAYTILILCSVIRLIIRITTHIGNVKSTAPARQDMDDDLREVLDSICADMATKQELAEVRILIPDPGMVARYMMTTKRELVQIGADLNEMRADIKNIKENMVTKKEFQDVRDAISGLEVRADMRAAE